MIKLEMELSFLGEVDKGMQVRRPILVGGIALSLGLWGLDSLGHAFSNISTVGLMTAAGAGWWWYQGQQKRLAQEPPVTPITPEAILALLDEVEVITARVIRESTPVQGGASASNPLIPPQKITDWAAKVQSRLTATQSSLSDRTLQIRVLGGSDVGKSTLIDRLVSTDLEQALAPWQVSIQKVPALFSQYTEGSEQSFKGEQPFAPTDTHSQILVASSEISLADLILFVIAGDLTESEYQILQGLQNRRQPFVVVLNKQDQYLPSDRDALIQQIQYRLEPLTEVENLVAIAANPNPIKVRRHDPAGATQEWLETQDPELSALTQRLTMRIAQEGQPMRWASALRVAELLKIEAKDQLNQLRRDRAQPIVENYQWISAGAAFVNPLPALDLLATAAVSTQMVLELGEVYQQKISVEHAQTVAGEIAKLLVKLGVAELASQAIASTLKTNFITYVAGGALQGISAAYLTRLAGLSLIDYFQAQAVVAPNQNASIFSISGLQERLQAAFEVHQKALNLPQFVTQGLRRLIPEATRVGA